MFDHLKVDQNSLGKLFANSEKDPSKNLSTKNGSDFFSMLMEQINLSDKRSQAESYSYGESERNIALGNPEDNLSVKISNDEVRSENIYENAYNESALVSKDEESPQHKQIDEIEREKLSSLKKVNDNNKSSEEDQNFILQLRSEAGIKSLMEIIKAALNGDKKGEDSGFKKLFANSKFSNDKSNNALTQPHTKSAHEAGFKNPNDVFAKMTKDFSEIIKRELSKVMDARSMGKKHSLTDRELKDIAINVIEGFKKNRARDVVRHEARTLPDDMKNDKKNISSTEQGLFKRIESADSSHLEKHSAGDKNPNRENYNFSSSKTDFSVKTGFDRIENNMKMPDFKENLQEIIDKAKITVRDNRNGAFTVKLNPQELGNVNVNLIMKNGVITGKFLVDNEDVKNILLNNIQELKYQLQEAGIEVGEFSVGVDSRHERALGSNVDETFEFPVSDSGELVAASEIYNSAAEAYNGHINLII